MKSRIDRGMRPWVLAIVSTSILVVLGAGPSASSALTFRGVATHAAGLRAAGPRAREGVARMATWTGMSWGQSRGSVTLDGSPGVPIANPKTRTLYVPIQCGDPSSNDSCNATADNFVDVINAAKCRPGSGAGCTRGRQGHGRLRSRSRPRSTTSTDTIYTANALRHRLGRRRRAVQREGNERLRHAGGDDPGRGISGRRGPRPADAHAVRRGPEWPRVRAERGRVQRGERHRMRRPGEDDQRPARSGLGRRRSSRPTPSTSRTTEPTRTGTPCLCSTGQRATARTGTAAVRAATRSIPGPTPSTSLVDQGTDTVYVANTQLQRRVRGGDQRRHLQRQDQVRLRAVAGPGADRVGPHVPGPRRFVAHAVCDQRHRRHDLRDRHQVLQRHRGLRDARRAR